MGLNGADGKRPWTSVRLGSWSAMSNNSIFELGQLPSRTLSGESSKSGSSSEPGTSILSCDTPAADSEMQWDATDDEQIVNSAFAQFVKAVSLTTPGSKVGCSIRRLRYKIKYNTASMETRTDGFLGRRGTRSTQEAFAFLEAKAHVLSSKEKERRSTYYQKSAEMVNWIMWDQKHGGTVPLRSLTNRNHSRLLIVQSRHEIYLVIATYDDEYVSYLEGKSPLSSSFMTMQQYGPFNINSAGDMKYLAEYLAGLFLHLSEEMP